MVTKGFELVRQVLLLLATILGSAVLLGATVVECISNYLGLTFAFQLLNADSRPLDRDPIFGSVITGLFNQLTFAETSALLMSLAMTVISYFLWHEFGKFYDAIHFFRLAARVKAEEDKEEWREIAIKRGFKIVSVALLLGIVFSFAVGLYRFRSAAALTGQVAAETAATMPNWAQLVSANQGFSMDLIGKGGYVNLAVNFLLAGLLAYMARRIGWRWEKLGETFATLFEGRYVMAPKNPDDPDPPVVLATPGPGAPLAPPPTLVPALAPQVVPSLAVAATPAARESVTLHMPTQRGVDSVPAGGEAGNTNHEEMFPVWGGSGEVTLTEAKAKPDTYIVDPVNGTIWSKPFYLQLHPDPA